MAALLGFLAGHESDGSYQVLAIYGGCGFALCVLGKTGMDAFLACKAAGGDLGKSHIPHTIISAVRFPIDFRLIL